jgi:hypothetical protein
MSSDRDVTRIVRSWMREDGHESADRVLDSVLDQLDTTPQRRATWWPARRFHEMNSFAKLGIAAAVLAVAAILGISYFAGPNVGRPGPTAEPTATPLDYVFPGHPDPLDPGTYRTDFGWDIGFSVVFTMPGGWESRGVELVKRPGSEAGVAIMFAPIENTYADPCAHTLSDPPIGPTIDDLAAALGSIQGLDATPPTEVTFAGYPARRIETSVAGSLGCEPSDFWILEDPEGTASLFTDGDVTEYWIVDVSGERFVIGATRYPDASSADTGELQAIVDSIRFEPGGS